MALCYNIYIIQRKQDENGGSRQQILIYKAIADLKLEKLLLTNASSIYLALFMTFFNHKKHTSFIGVNTKTMFPF